MIKVENLTLKYPSGKGVFDVSFQVKEGVISGYLGPNGAGKTTTIRGLLGFMKPDNGTCTINNLDSWKDSTKIQKELGYIPGEISFVENMRGDEYLKFISKMRKTNDDGRQKDLLDMLDFSPKGYIKKYSKGMKQKLSIVSAFMHDPQVLIMDEPTSGLDPLMQSRFVDLLKSEKKRGKTILMSSHIFEEVERTCDNVLIIKEGKLVASSDIDTLKKSQKKTYLIKTDEKQKAIELFEKSGFKASFGINESVEIVTSGESIDDFIKVAAKLNIKNLDVKSQSLEDIFMHFYSKEDN